MAEVSRKIGVTEQTYYRWRKAYGGMPIAQAKRLKALERENGQLKKLVADLSLDNAILKGSRPGKLLSPSRRRQVISQVCEALHVSVRRACRVLGQARTTQRHAYQVTSQEERLTARIIDLATKYGRYGYRRITALLREEQWMVNHKRVERIWRQEGLKVPKKQPKRGRLWLNDGSCVRLRPDHRDHVWSYDFMVARTIDGRAFRLLNILDEYTRECLAIKVEHCLNSQDVIDQLFNLFIERGSPWENGYIDSFNARIRDELLNREIFNNLAEAKILIEGWRKEYNQRRPHSALGYRPPAPEAIVVPGLT